MIEFYPKRLTEVLETVRRTHTLRRGETPKISRSVVDEVRKILAQAKDSELERVIFQFNLKQLLACVEIVAIDGKGDIAKRAAHSVELRPKEMMIPLAWFKLTKKFPNALLRYLINILVESKGAKAIENHDKISNHVLRWLMDQDLTMGIINDYRSSSKHPDFDKYLTTHFLSEQESLYKVSWKSLLLKGNAPDLKNQKPGRILEEINSELKSSVSIKMGQHYLNTLQIRKNWDELLLIYIYERWDRPIHEHVLSDLENRFWHGVSKKARQDFHAWLLMREIGDFFEGERADFWRDYAEKGIIKDVEKILEGRGFILVFNRFGVIEFKDKGNAAYIYPIKTLNDYRRDSNFRNFMPADYKNLSKTIQLKSMPYWDGRIIHRGNWQYDTRNRINKIISEI